MNVLGLSAFGGASAAALVRDGVPVAALREERFSGKKNDATFPRRAARGVLRCAGVSERELDAVVFYEKPLRRFERTIVSRMRAFPRGARAFADDVFLWLGDRLWLADKISEELQVPREKVLFCEHHLAHAAAAFWASPCEQAAILILDGEGEWPSTSLGRGSQQGIELFSQLRHPHSLSLLASAVASYCGLESRPGEPLLFALATHGEPRYLRQFETLLGCGASGELRFGEGVFRLPWNPASGFGPALVAELGEAREAGSRLRYEGTQRRDADVAASLQAALEALVLRWARELQARAGCADLCLGGDLAWNSSLVARLGREALFQRIFVPLDPGDAGAALGAALYATKLLGGEVARGLDHGFLGEQLIGDPQPSARRLEPAAIPDEIARRLSCGQLVGWMHGRAEWGPRALGHRSLLADARSQSAVDRLRRLVKRREPWLAFSPAVLAERAGECFEIPTQALACSRAMQVAAATSAELRAQAPSLVAGDGTSRPQLVSRDADADFHAMLSCFAARTGVPYVLHTSLNQRGDAIVRGESDALALMERTPIDAVVVEDRLYEARV